MFNPLLMNDRDFEAWLNDDAHQADLRAEYHASLEADVGDEPFAWQDYEQDDCWPDAREDYSMDDMDDYITRENDQRGTWC